MNNVNSYDQKSEDFDRMEKKILNEVVSISKSLIDTFKFSMVYNSKVSQEQEKKTENAVSGYRNKHWAEALKKSNGDKDKAYNLYLEKYSKFLS